MIEFRQATADDATLFYGHAPKMTMRGFVIVLDGTPVAIFGIYFEHQQAIAFSEMKPALRPYKKALVKACRMFQQLVAGLHRPVYAVADQNEPTAPYLLIKLGFRPTGIVGPQGEVLMMEN